MIMKIDRDYETVKNERLLSIQSSEWVQLYCIMLMDIISWKGIIDVVIYSIYFLNTLKFCELLIFTWIL